MGKTELLFVLQLGGCQPALAIRTGATTGWPGVMTPAASPWGQCTSWEVVPGPAPNPHLTPLQHQTPLPYPDCATTDPSGGLGPSQAAPRVPHRSLRAWAHAGPPYPAPAWSRTARTPPLSTVSQFPPLITPAPLAGLWVSSLMTTRLLLLSEV